MYSQGDVDNAGENSIGAEYPTSNSTSTSNSTPTEVLKTIGDNGNDTGSSTTSSLDIGDSPGSVISSLGDDGKINFSNEGGSDTPSEKLMPETTFPQMSFTSTSLALQSTIPTITGATGDQTGQVTTMESNHVGVVEYAGMRGPRGLPGSPIPISTSPQCNQFPMQHRMHTPTYITKHVHRHRKTSEKQGLPPIHLSSPPPLQVQNSDINSHRVFMPSPGLTQHQVFPVLPQSPPKNSHTPVLQVRAQYPSSTCLPTHHKCTRCVALLERVSDLEKQLSLYKSLLASNGSHGGNTSEATSPPSSSSALLIPKATVEILALPPELLLRVFWQLSISDRVMVQSVCRRWKDVARHSSLWRVLKVFGDLQLAMVAKAGYFQGLKHISLYLVSDVSLALLSKLHLNLLTLQIFGEGITDSPMADLSRSCTDLQEFSVITTSKQVTDAGIVPFSKTCKNLRKLTLRCEDVSHAAITLLLASAPIRHLNLRCPMLTDTSVKHLTRFCKNLRHLDLVCNSNMTDLTLVNLVQCTALRSLKLEMCSSFTEGALEMAVRSFANLKELRITKFLPVLPSNFSAFISVCSNLTSLSLELDDDYSLQAISAMCPRLQKLELQCGGHIGDDQVKNLPGVMNTLTVLHLDESAVTDEGVRHIANNCTTLTDLSLFGCAGVSDTALLYIAGGTLPHLAKLDLNGCKHVTSTGVRFVLSQCKQLHELYSPT